MAQYLQVANLLHLLEDVSLNMEWLVPMALGMVGDEVEK